MKIYNSPGFIHEHKMFWTFRPTDIHDSIL